MRAQVPAPDEVLSWRVRVDSWLGDVEIAHDVPVAGGSLSWATGAPALEESAVSVPGVDDAGRDWWPRADPDHALARFGQRLQHTLVAETTSGPVEVALARHRVAEWTRGDDGVVDVRAQSSMRDLAVDELAAPVSTPQGCTLTVAAMMLAGPGTEVVVDPRLSDRVVDERAWGESRSAGLVEIAAAWPALLRLDPWGRVLFSPPLSVIPDPVLSLTDGAGGVVVSVEGLSDTRADQPNVVVAQGREVDGVTFRRELAVMEGPMAPARYGRVVDRVTSDLVTSEGLAAEVARAALSQAVVRAVTWRVHCPPDWRLEVDDPVEVVHAGQTRWGWVTGIHAPLFPGGLFRVDVGIVQ